jgi:nucleoside 2-deoxyribosyltransferase
MRLYIAGPLFTPYHQAFHEENVRRLREAGHLCFVPQEQEHNKQREAIQAGGDAPAEGFDTRLAQAVFEVDMIGVRNANALVALLDDPDVSSGTACEMGIFYELALHDPSKKAILGILTDDRPRRRDTSGVGESINFFTLGSVLKKGAVYPSIDGVIEHLARWQAELESEGHLQPGPDDDELATYFR